ncbi:hypothetical protein FDENT_5216 [Fusarium denticulatum]|uniref:Uncharacterized protein n=1 Tax=Fusarium denticulatum TaxID=48507 RepID=A0A8H5UEY7_9HYPO|nr:hypothetical protein FDENT_5216 [Fusarium denticulatum]
MAQQELTSAFLAFPHTLIFSNPLSSHLQVHAMSEIWDPALVLPAPYLSYKTQAYVEPSNFVAISAAPSSPGEVSSAATIDPSDAINKDFELRDNDGKPVPGRMFRRPATCATSAARPVQQIGSPPVRTRVGKDSMNFSQVPDSDPVPITGTSVCAHWARCVQVYELWKDITSALAANGVDTVRRELTVERLSLSDEDCETIDTHLFKAYLSQLVVHNLVQDDLEFLDVSTRRPKSGFLSEAGATHDFERVLQTYGPAFGIYHHLIRGNGKVMFRDWTSVSSGIVDEWMEENWDRSREYATVIRTMEEDETLPRPNYDEYN